MRVLVVPTHDFFSTYGGGQVYVKNLVDELIDRGLDTVIATPGDPTASPHIYRKSTVYAFSVSALNRQSDEIDALLKMIKPDLVHAHGAKATFVKACAAQGIPCIVTAHHGGILCPAGALLNHRDSICRVRASHWNCLPCVLKNIRGGIVSWPLMRLFPLQLRLWIGRFLRKRAFILYATPVGTASLSIQEKADDWKTIHETAALLVAPSRVIAESMVRNGAPDDKVKILPHGIVLPDNAEREACKRAGEPFDDCARFFYVGRVCYGSGLHVLLKAFSGVGGRRAELHIIGGAGNKEEERYMQRMKRKSRKDQRVVWHGKIQKEKVDGLISRFDVMIHPAIYLEVFGLTIAEALALGKPVVATRCGGAEQQIQDGVNGFLVEPNDVQSLRGAMQMFVDKVVDSEKMAHAGPGSVKQMTEHASELISFYHQVVAKA